MTARGQRIRKREDWIAGFLELSGNIASPTRYRSWTALCTISAALERRCWVTTSSGRIFPNMFTMLVAPPAVGKSLAIDMAKELIDMTGKLHMTPGRTTRAALEDYAAEVCLKAPYIDPDTGVQSTNTPMSAFIGEFGNFCPEHDLDFLAMLTVLYDCTPHYEARTRYSKTQVKLKNTCMNILAGAQPKLLSNLLPEAAWGQGFMTRVIMIYEGQSIKKSLWDISAAPPKDLKAFLVKDLIQISNLKGEFTVDDDARDVMEAWHLGGQSPIPDHPRLQGYNGRRILHAFKLSMALCASRSNEMIITGDHVREALAMLFDVEERMPQIFSEMSSGGYGEALDELWAAMWRSYTRSNQQPVPETFLFDFLMARVPTNQVKWAIENLVKSGKIQKVGNNDVGSGLAKYRPIRATILGENT